MDKHSDRTTVLSKLNDKYVYDDVNFPANFDDVEQFEINNKVSVFVYCIGDDGKSIVREKCGNRDYVLNECIYLFRIENDEQSH